MNRHTLLEKSPNRFYCKKKMSEAQLQQIHLFKSIFKGREDVFAMRWESGKKSGYMLETLDTDEATYLWHIEKDKMQLKSQLNTIDQHLTMIRNMGRQTFLESKPDNFSRILHDYTDSNKGFVIWKDLLEERIE